MERNICNSFSGNTWWQKFYKFPSENNSERGPCIRTFLFGLVIAFSFQSFEPYRFIFIMTCKYTNTAFVQILMHWRDAGIICRFFSVYPRASTLKTIPEMLIPKLDYPPPPPHVKKQQKHILIIKFLCKIYSIVKSCYATV